MRKLLSALAFFCILAALPVQAFDTARGAGAFVVFEDQDGIGCWALAKSRIIEFYLSQDEDKRTTSVVLVYDSGKIAVARRPKAGRASGGDVNPGEVYKFEFRREADAQRFIKELIKAVSAD
jgi:hypothetical protein